MKFNHHQEFLTTTQSKAPCLLWRWVFSTYPLHFPTLPFPFLCSSYPRTVLSMPLRCSLTCTLPASHSPDALSSQVLLSYILPQAPVSVYLPSTQARRSYAPSSSTITLQSTTFAHQGFFPLQAVPYNNSHTLPTHRVLERKIHPPVAYSLGILSVLGLLSLGFLLIAFLSFLVLLILLLVSPPTSPSLSSAPVPTLITVLLRQWAVHCSYFYAAKITSFFFSSVCSSFFS